MTTKNRICIKLLLYNIKGATIGRPYMIIYHLWTL